MAVSGIKLWTTLCDKEIKLTELRNAVEMSITNAKQDQNEFIFLVILEMICAYSHGDISDIIQFVPNCHQSSGV